MRRRRFAIPLAGLVTAGSLLLGACGSTQTAVADARRACVYVQRSLATFERAQHDAGTAHARALRAEAANQLEEAVPFAAEATVNDPQWNPLQTTLKEASGIDEQYLVGALRQQCAMANSPNPQAPVINPGAPGQHTPSTLPGQ